MQTWQQEPRVLRLVHIVIHHCHSRHGKSFSIQRVLAIVCFLCVLLSKVVEIVAKCVHLFSLCRRKTEMNRVAERSRRPLLRLWGMGQRTKPAKQVYFYRFQSYQPSSNVRSVMEIPRKTSHQRQFHSWSTCFNETLYNSTKLVFILLILFYLKLIQSIFFKYDNLLTDGFVL